MGGMSVSRQRNLGKTEWPKEELCLVGIGKQSLSYLMEQVKASKDELSCDAEELMWMVRHGEMPPRYRATRICSEEEKQAFVEFQEWLDEQFTGEE